MAQSLFKLAHWASTGEILLALPQILLALMKVYDIFYYQCLGNFSLKKFYYSVCTTKITHDNCYAILVYQSFLRPILHSIHRWKGGQAPQLFFYFGWPTFERKFVLKQQVTISIVRFCPKHGKLQVWLLHFPNCSSIYDSIQEVISDWLMRVMNGIQKREVCGEEKVKAEKC